MRYWIFLFLLLSLGSCHQKNDSGSMALMDLKESDQFEEIMDIPVSRQPIPPPPDAADKPIPVPEKKIIKTGHLTFRVEDTEGSDRNIRQQLKKQGAYIENENQWTRYDRKSIELTIRVKSTEFDSLFHSLALHTKDIEERTVLIEDVTERYYDLKARIKNRKALEERYLDLLKKANTVKDMLEIEKNLNELRTEIEIQEGKFRYLSKQVSYSTIHLTFYELLPYSYTSEVQPGFGERLKASFGKGWHVFLSFTVGLIGLWPFLLLLAAVLLLLKKWRRRRGAAAK